MVQEKALATKPQLERAEAPQAHTRFYEVIVKFHKDGRPVVEAFLLAHMTDVTISATENSELLLAYCHFHGDIKTLDGKLSALRQSAMVVLGDKEERFLDFFVALRQLSKPLPRLLSAPRGSTIPAFFTADWVKGFLVALGFLVLWQGYHLTSAFISRVLNPPPRSVSAPTRIYYSEWAPYVLPEYQQAWLEVKRKHGLSDETMIKLFRRIKSLDRFGPGHTLHDLTIYPKAIDRALSLIILKDVNDTEALRGLYKTLAGYSAQWKSLPDSPERIGGGLSLAGADDSFNDQVVLTFYEQILKQGDNDLTRRLIDELRRAALAG